MPADPSGNQEPEEESFPFSLGQGVRIIEGPFTDMWGPSVGLRNTRSK